MPGCCAIGCSNRSDNGFSLYGFPRNPQRRKEWLIKTKRDSWTPTDSSRICAVHFEADQFEVSPMGKKRLKSCAEPTLFTFKGPQRRRKPPKRRTCLQQSTVNEYGVVNDHSYCNYTNYNAELNDDSKSEKELGITEATGQLLMGGSNEKFVDASEVERITDVEVLDTSDGTLLVNEQNLAAESCPEPAVFKEIISCTESCHCQHKVLNQAIKMQKIKFQRSMKSLQDKLKHANLEKKMLKQSLSSSQEISCQQKKELAFLHSRLRKVSESSKAQVGKKAMPEERSVQTDRSKHGQRWSSADLKKAFQLKFVCGTLGYETLLQQGFKVPTIRTLNKRAEKFRFDSG